MVGKVVGEITGEATEGAHRAEATLVEIPSMVGPPVGAFPMVMMSNSSRLHASLPCTSQMLDPLLGRSEDQLIVPPSAYR